MMGVDRRGAVVSGVLCYQWCISNIMYSVLLYIQLVINFVTSHLCGGCGYRQLYWHASHSQEKVSSSSDSNNGIGTRSVLGKKLDNFGAVLEAWMQCRFWWLS